MKNQAIVCCHKRQALGLLMPSRYKFRLRRTICKDWSASVSLACLQTANHPLTARSSYQKKPRCSELEYFLKALLPPDGHVAGATSASETLALQSRDSKAWRSLSTLSSAFTFSPLHPLNTPVLCPPELALVCASNAAGYVFHFQSTPGLIEVRITR
jgi:hypothetical protein